MMTLLINVAGHKIFAELEEKKNCLSNGIIGFFFLCFSISLPHNHNMTWQFLFFFFKANINCDMFDKIYVYAIMMALMSSTKNCNLITNFVITIKCGTSH